jgi:DNA polymerase epsilon subunit 1
MRDRPVFSDPPLIYHLDVAAMYPNIMLSNRLQPDSVVDESMCAACDYNRPGKTCDRRMTWAWRGEFFPAKLDEFKMIRNALEQESFPAKYKGGPSRRFVDLSATEQTSLLHKRLGDYSRKVYKKTHEAKIVYKEAIICQRENPFYVDTVRNFRDRRYIYKGHHKTWKKNLDKAQEKGGSRAEVVEAKKMIVLYDSLQLAHKCILNSFYGYVMRKGARWHSMEMAGITCLTGASIIQMARQLVEQIGRPLELDTDGIWCMLPRSFPDEFTFTLANGKKQTLSYPTTMLNHLVHEQFTNDQYHDLTDPERGTYAVHKENSIFFELDGPYRAMILPSSKEEDKLLKKRYAVFNEDGSLAELKGFEVKRRGELQLIKTFQTQIFERFLLGSDLQECYAAVAVVADKWLDVLTTKAANLPDDELVELIAENRSMSKTLAEYAGQKSTSISTARRLAEFLGEQMVKDKGLACRFIVSAKPNGAPVTDRAVPVAIFSAMESVKRQFLRKWLKDNSLTDYSLRSILDWDYYIERLGSVIQKIITIPAAMQKITNPVPRIHHPDWLMRRMATLDDKFKQHKLVDMFANQRKRAEAQTGVPVGDLEDFGTSRKAVASAPLTEEGDRQKAKPPPPPDFEVDYRGWIKAMKPIWRKRRLENAAAGIRPGARNIGGRLGSLLRQQHTLLMSHTWDIIQIADVPGRPGEFRLWLLIRDTLQSVRLKVPRTFYLNLEDSSHAVFPPSCRYESIVRTLPRSQRCLDLVKVNVDEADFLEDDSAFSLLLDQPEVKGVYELQVPLIVRALMKLGSSCTIESQSGTNLGRGLDRGFALDELVHAPPVSRRRYLDRGAPLRYIYFYHATADTRHVIGLFVPDAPAKVLIVDRGGNRQVPNLEKYYSEQIARRRSSESTKSKEELAALKGVFEYPGKLQIDVSFHQTEDAAFRSVTREITTLNAQRPGPSLLVTYSAKDGHYYEVCHHPFVMRAVGLCFGCPRIAWDPPLPFSPISLYTPAVLIARSMLSAGKKHPPNACFNTTSEFRRG